MAPGALGLAFWQRIRDLLTAVEASLGVWCVLESDLGAEALDTLFPERSSAQAGAQMTAADLDGRVEPAFARKLWGKWLGRERDFYRECARRIEPLAWQEVLRIGGSEVAVRVRLTRQAFEEMTSEKLPERLKPGSLQILSTGREGVLVVSYSGADPLMLDPAILQVLPYFDGRPTVEALRAIENELGVRVEEDLLRKLTDFEILIPAASESA